MKRFFTMLLVACLSTSIMGLASYAAPDSALSQQTSKRHVSGLVTDESGLPVPGAAVVVQSNRTIGTVTDPDGTFSMMVPGDTKVLEVNSLGYETALVSLTSAESYNVILREDTQMLEGTVVVGYGTMKRRDLTGAVSHVKTEELTAYPVTDPVYALQGRVPGVVISQNTGTLSRVAMILSTSSTVSHQVLLPSILMILSLSRFSRMHLQQLSTVAVVRMVSFSSLPRRVSQVRRR